MATKGRKIGRDAKTGEFISVEEARRRKSTAVVQVIKYPKKKKEKGVDHGDHRR